MLTKEQVAYMRRHGASDVAIALAEGEAARIARACADGPSRGVVPDRDRINAAPPAGRCAHCDVPLRPVGARPENRPSASSASFGAAAWCSRPACVRAADMRIVMADGLGGWTHAAAAALNRWNDEANGVRVVRRRRRAWLWAPVARCASWLFEVRAL